jgi:YVTN family beta-propeller protein
MEFRVLGELEVLAGDRPLELGGAKQRSVLSMLVLQAGNVVSTDTLIDGLWGERPPATAAKSLQVYVSRLRKALGENAIVTRPPGYLLDATPEQVDVGRFERLVEEAKREAPAAAAATFRHALGLWRGSALADLAEEPFARAEIARLDEQRLAALENRIDADLALGRHSSVVAELEGLVRTHPYRERLRGQLMLALYRSGRQADALDAYRDARTALAEQLGLEPGHDLKDLERRILSQDPSLAAPSDPERSPTTYLKRPSRRALVLLGAFAAAAAAGVTIAVLELTDAETKAPIVAQANSVALIDQKRNALAEAIPIGERPTRIAIHGDDVWVLHPDRGTISHLSRAERTLLGTVGAGSAPSNLAAEERGVWVSDARNGTVTLIESERLTVADTVRTRKRPLAGPLSDAGLLAIGYGSLWYASGGRTITRIDQRTGRVTARIRDVETGESNGAITVGADSVWVAGQFQGSPLTRIDPRRNAVLARIALPKFRSGGAGVAGGAVWVADPGGDQVWRVDPLRNIPVATAQVGAAPLGVVSGHGSVWVANSGDGTVSRIDPDSGRVIATIAVGGSPNGLAVTDDGVWVTVA